MPFDYNSLQPAFAANVRLLMGACQQAGYPMEPYFGLRTPFVQARLWRQSRTAQQIQAKVNDLRSQGCHFLAYCIESVGPQNGVHVTNAIPGLSWHQWGEALDCYWVVNGGAEWSVDRTINGKNGYRVYAAEAIKLGLTAGGYWRSIQDWPHVQSYAADSPISLHPLSQIDKIMEQRFGNM